MLDSEKVAIAAHLHVLMRRITGRVTDTEWLAQNPEYATAMIRVARLAAIEESRPDLADWAGKLEVAMGLRPAAPVVAPPAAPVRPPVAAAPAPQAVPSQRPPGPPGPDGGPRYVGGLR